MRVSFRASPGTQADVSVKNSAPSALVHVLFALPTAVTKCPATAREERKRVQSVVEETSCRQGREAAALAAATVGKQREVERWCSDQALLLMQPSWGPGSWDRAVHTVRTPGHKPRGHFIYLLFACLVVFIYFGFL